MNKIEQMVKEMCPGGVKYYRLSEIAEIGTGSGNRQDAVGNGQYPFFVRSKEVLRSGIFQFDEEAILIPGEGGIGDIFHYYNGKYALHQRTYRVHPKNNAALGRYLYYYLATNFKQYILGKAVAATVTSIRKPMIENFTIPLPPLPIQEAIVEILDKFESLQQGLQDELQARKKQYEYYRNKLLTQFPDSVQVKEVPLLHFAKNYTGLTYEPQDVSEKGKLVLRSSNIQNGQLCFDDNVFVDMNIPERSIVKKDDILVCVRNGSANLVGKAALITEQAAGMAFGAFMTILRVDNQEELDAHYLFHLWNSQYIKDQINGSEGAAIKQITNGMLKNINIRLPKLSIQKEISKKIDKFERLQQGLQDEIAAVKKQYEYYRNKLLTF